MGKQGRPRKKLALPFYPQTGKKATHPYRIYTQDEKMIADYCNCTISEVEELDFIEYLVYLRDAFIDRMNQTEEGQEYLQNAYRITQTAPQRGKLREQFGTKKG